MPKGNEKITERGSKICFVGVWCSTNRLRVLLLILERKILLGTKEFELLLKAYKKLISV